MTQDSPAIRSALEKLYQEHRVQARHVETLRSGVMTVLSTGAGALLGLTDLKDGVGRADWPLGAVILGLGVFGVLFTAKLHERLRWSMVQAEVTLEAFEAMTPGAGLAALTRTARQRHQPRHRLMSRFKMSVMWSLLALTIAATGVMVLALALTGAP